MELAGEAVKTYDAIEDCDYDNSERRRMHVTDAGGTVVNLYGKQYVCMHDIWGLHSLVIGDVFIYLTTNCDLTRERLKQFKRDEYFRMYLDKHV